MPERYNMVFRLPPRLYLEGSPILIEAGAIQKDTQTNKLLVQLKFRNISSKTIIACKVKINAYSVSGDQLDGVESFSYLDLNVHSGEEFGSKTPIYLPNYETRKFTSCVTQVVFADNSIWNAEATEWSQVSEPTKIENGLQDNSRIHDGELVKQYKIEVGNHSDYYPEIKDGLFYCTCGNINMDSVEHCHFCRREYSDLARILEVGYLTSRKDARLAREAEERRVKMQQEAEERAARIQREQENKDKRKKLIKIAVPVAIVLVALAVAGYYLFSKVIIPRQKHDEAMQLLASGNYESAYALLAELGDNDEIISSKNDRALSLLESGNYDEAYALYEELGNTEAIETNKYDRAMSLIELGNYDEAYVLLEEIGNNEAIISSETDRAMAMIDDGNYEEAYALLEELGNNEAVSANMYDRAVACVDSGEYQEAVTLLTGLDYGDSEALLESAMQLCYEEAFSNPQVGSYVLFGSYEQDNNLSNGPEPIEWRILDVEDGRMLLLSRYALDCQPFDENGNTNIWKNCSLRDWLNDDFYTAAFTTDEQDMIQTTSLTTGMYDYSLDDLISPVETQDRVFIMSHYDLDDVGYAGLCQATDYCSAQGASILLNEAGNNICLWWDRVPAIYSSSMRVSYYNNSYGWDLAEADSEIIAVRPAIWVSIES